MATSIRMVGALIGAVVLPLATVPQSSAAAPAKSGATGAAAAGATVFSCRTASGKLLRISRNGETFRYSYAKAGAPPDLAFTVPRSAVSIRDGSEDIGSGSWWMTHEVTLRFNGTSYTGWWSFNRASEEEAGGIRVAKGGRVLAETPCQLPVEINLPAD